MKESASFIPIGVHKSVPVTPRSLVELAAAGGKKKRRRRKDRNQPPGSTAPDPVKVAQEKVEGEDVSTDSPVEDAVAFDLKPDDIAKGGSLRPMIRSMVISSALLTGPFSFSPPQAAQRVGLHPFRILRILSNQSQ